MTTIATTMETQICKIALRKIAQRATRYSATNSLPILGQILSIVGRLVTRLFLAEAVEEPPNGFSFLTVSEYKS